MSVRVNGKEHPWSDGMTVRNLLDELNKAKTPVVVRVGPRTVARKDFPSFPIPDDVDIYFIYMVAGG